MKIFPYFRPSITAASLLFLACGSQISSAASWQGGNGGWTSNNWNLVSPNPYPGSANYPSEGATIGSGQVLIQTGDLIVTSGVVFVNNTGSILQTGGAATFSNRLDMRTTFTLQNGTVNATGSTRVSGGGVYSIQGGTFNGGTTSEFRFEGGNGTLLVSGGSFSVRNILMNATANNTALVSVMGSNITKLEATSFSLTQHASSTSGSATARFTFDSGGIAAWNILGGASSLTLGTGTLRGDLYTDVSALISNGTTGYRLFNYTNVNAVNGQFGDIAIYDSTWGNLVLGTQGALNPGEYFLDMGGVLGNTGITLYYNTIPEPSQLTLLTAALLFAFTFRRKNRGLSA